MLKIIQSSVSDVDDFFSKSLAGRENDSHIRQLTDDLCLTTQSISTVTQQLVGCDDTMIRCIDRLIEMENNSNSSTFGNAGLVMNKKDKKEFDQLITLINKSQETKKIYGIKKNLDTMIKKAKFCNQSINDKMGAVTSTVTDMLAILREWEYIEPIELIKLEPEQKMISANNITFKSIKLKGVIAAQINEANPIIMTELIVGNYFDTLTTEESIALVSVFIDRIKTSSGKEYGPHEFEGTVRLHDTIDRIQTMVGRFSDIEKSWVGENSGYADWSISIDYMDLVLSWVRGDDLKSMLEMIDGYEERKGSFIRNMIKISSIIKDVRAVCKMIGKIEIYTRLERADEMIFRDIVTLDSIYITG
jgi:superfamily II RNA helicase